MDTRSKVSRGVRALGSIALGTALALAAAHCGRETTVPPVVGREDAGPVRDAGADAQVPDADVPDAGSCVDPTRGCWACAPTTDVQLTNACTDASCVAFPLTTARLPRLGANGALPPLP